MSTDEKSETQCISAMPYEWWVAGLFGDTMALYCPRTGQWGIVADPSDEEWRKARDVHRWGLWQPEVFEGSYRWLDFARVRPYVAPKDVRTSCSKQLRSLLFRMLSEDPKGTSSTEALQTRRQDIACLNQAILQLECVEFEHYLELRDEIYQQTGEW